MTDTALATLEDYAGTGKYNVLSPIAEVVGDVESTVLVQSLSVVKINTNEEAGEIYHDFRYAKKADGKASLSSQGLTKIANAAGVEWMHELCGVQERVRRADGHTYMRYQAAARIRQPNGEWHSEFALKEIDTADEAEELEENDRRAWDRAKTSRGDKPYWMRGLSEDDGSLDRAIEQRVRQQIMQLRKFIGAHAETKAKSRVIRRLLSLKQTYTKSELDQPFVVPRLLYRPDLTDSWVAEQVETQGRQATTALFGGTPTTPHRDEAAREPTALPSSDTIATAAPDPGTVAEPTPETEPRGTTEPVDAVAAVQASLEVVAGAQEEGPPAATESDGDDDAPTELEAKWAQLIELCGGDKAKARRTVTRANTRTVPVKASNDQEVTVEELDAAIDSL